jgi:acetyltransferase-like isoleucine patch superfamily enzyme
MHNLIIKGFWGLYLFYVRIWRKLRWLFHNLELDYLRYCGLLVGDGFIIDQNVTLTLGKGAKLIIGRGVYIGEYSLITVNAGASLAIGENTFIAHHNSISSNTLCHIGNFCAIAPYVTLIDAQHKYEDVTCPIRFQGGEYGEFFVDDEVWIGTGAIILKDVRLGKHCVIGANSVVTKNIPPFSVAVGIPAKVIKTLEISNPASIN